MGVTGLAAHGGFRVDGTVPKFGGLPSLVVYVDSQLQDI